MRAQEEILKRIEEVAKGDFFGFERDVLIQSLDFEHAKPFLKDEATAEQWMPTAELTDEKVRASALSYIKFAWGKAEDHRGLSASRSVQKMTSYLWLLGLDEHLKKMEEAEYAQYGAPKLKIASEALGYQVPTSETMLRMMAGEPCRPDCAEGCGR